MNEIKPAYQNNNVAICFSINNKYAPLLATTLVSIAENSNPQNNYDIVVLIADLNEENQKRLSQIVNNRPNFSIRFVNVYPYVFGYNFYTDSSLTNTKYTYEIYFRLLAPAVINAYEKVLFLDADLIVKSDIAELYKIKIDDQLIGAVRDYEGIASCYLNNYERTKYRIEELGLKNFNNYFASGVILMNIIEFNRTFTVKSLLDMAVSRKWKQYDQDILNFICKGKVKLLGSEWNFVEDINGSYGSLPVELFAEYSASEKSPKIVHFSADRKPWINTVSKQNLDFWKFAELTPYKEVLSNLLVNNNF